jgi:nitrite reductase/ring-hydroxylating ferredoxin subunit
MLACGPTMPWHDTTLPADTSRSPAVVPVTVGATAMVLVAWDGRWYAVEDRCSHAGCSFIDDGEIDGFHAICNCHGSEFDVRTGEVVRPPAREPIRTYPVRAVGGLIEVER